jgi:hypothetical protein
MNDPPARDHREPTIRELKALADYAAQRLALYKRRILLGRGDPTRLAELERSSTGAAARLRRARERAGQETRTTAARPQTTTTGEHHDQPAH